MLGPESRHYEDSKNV